MNAETERTQRILSSCIHDKLLIQKKNGKSNGRSNKQLQNCCLKNVKLESGLNKNYCKNGSFYSERKGKEQENRCSVFIFF